MKRFIPVFLVFASMITKGASAAPAFMPPHLDLEMTGQEYRSFLDQKYANARQDLGAPHALDPVIKWGARNLEWLSHMNQFRDAGQKLSFSSKETQVGVPIEMPGRNNVALVLKLIEDLKRDLPDSMKKIIFGGQKFTDSPPIEESEYLRLGRLMDRAYQRAARWILQEPLLGFYASYRYRDVRGYYFLMREPDLELKLKDWKNLDAAVRDRLTPLLLGSCLNSLRAVDRCNSAWKAQEDKLAFWKAYQDQSAKLFASFFALQNPRPEMEWNSKNPKLFLVPFSDPGSDLVRDFLSVNLEDEWKLGDWNLKVKFEKASAALTQIEFVAGAVPHVNGLGGNMITMDANQPLTEYNVQWTIRHEFGHVLGLPDCYVEFYDQEAKEMLNYQIDTTNLMCSRKGHILQTHYDELKRGYFSGRI